MFEEAQVARLEAELARAREKLVVYEVSASHDAGKALLLREMAERLQQRVQELEQLRDETERFERLQVARYTKPLHAAKLSLSMQRETEIT